MNAIDTNVFVYALDAAEPQAGVTRLYSEDMQHGADYDGVSIVNPFL